MMRKHGISHVSSGQDSREAKSRREHRDTDGLGLEVTVTEIENSSIVKAREHEVTTLPAKDSIKNS